MSAHDPLDIPADFWQQQDVIHALDRRDIGTLFRLLRQYRGASQHRIGAMTGIAQGHICTIMHGSSVTSIEVLQRIADGLTMPDDARIRVGLAPKEVDPVRRRTALTLGLAATLSPATLAKTLHQAAAEAMEFIRERATRTIGAGTIEHLTTVVAQLDHDYPWRPATELFPIAHAYRHHVESLINGKHTLAEGNELHVHAAYLSHILADLVYNLGSTPAARVFATDSYELAQHAGHHELCAWAADTHAAVMRYTDRPNETVNAALKGLKRVPRRHPLAAQLRARAALGYAQQGNRAKCVEMLTKARAVCDALPDTMPSRLSTDTAESTSSKIDTYAAECHVGLRSWKEAEQRARTALGTNQSRPDSAAGARLNLGIALANLGSPDEAAEQGKQALTFGRNYGAGYLRSRAHTLDTILMSRYSKEPAVQEFHVEYEQITAAHQN